MIAGSQVNLLHGMIAKNARARIFQECIETMRRLVRVDSDAAGVAFGFALCQRNRGTAPAPPENALKAEGEALIPAT